MEGRRPGEKGIKGGLEISHSVGIREEESGSRGHALNSISHTFSLSHCHVINWEMSSDKSEVRNWSTADYFEVEELGLALSSSWVTREDHQ